jgi:putative transcriptional regulator
MHQLRNYLAAGLVVPLLLLVSGWSNAADLLPGTDSSHTVRSATTSPAPGMFLVSARELQDRHFRKTVVYILRHNQNGTLGLIINRPGALPLSHAIDNIDIDHASQHRLFYGGPVETSIITMLMENLSAAPLAEHIAGDIYFSNRRIVMERLLKEKKPPSKLHFFYGHAGWIAGQLEQELDRGDWHLIDGNPRSIFSSEIGTLWQRLIRKLEPLGIIAWAADLPALQSN